MNRVIFRKWQDNGQIIAFFPDQVNGQFIGSYMHIGQHSDAMYPCATVPATPEEYAPLLKELVSIGYDDLVIRKRFIR